MFITGSYLQYTHGTYSITYTPRNRPLDQDHSLKRGRPTTPTGSYRPGMNNMATGTQIQAEVLVATSPPSRTLIVFLLTGTPANPINGVCALLH